MSALAVITGTGHDVRIVPLPMIRRRRVLPVPISGFLGWMAAALGVYSIAFLSRGPFRGASPASFAVAKIVLIVVVGAVFARVVRGVAAELVFGTGLVWLVFSIAADFAAGVRSVDAAYRLLGDPTVVPQNLRNLTILVWLAAPILFARRGDREDEHSGRSDR